MDGLTDLEEVDVDTPFGKPSDSILLGTLGPVRLAFLPRHGRGHRILPSELPALANIWALKQLGVGRVISVSAVGSLRDELQPLHVVVPDQLIDRTRGRPSTFFGRGLVAHVAFAQPFCPVLRDVLYGAGETSGAKTHHGGTSVVIDGPAFSTQAESRMYRAWNADIIGMTALPEAKLAREAELCYANLSLVTDYDAWHESREPVTAEMIIGNLTKNVETAKRIVATAVGALSPERECACPDALAMALVTPGNLVPEDTKRELEPIVGRYMRVEALS